MATKNISVGRDEELIQNIKDCGQSLIDNAEKIYGNYKYGSSLIITCYPFEDFPRIVFERELIPENVIDRHNK